MLNKDSANGGFNPKHRMIGAIVLVVAAVIIVPLVLNKRAPPENAPGTQGPATQTIVVPVTPNDVPAEAAPSPMPAPEAVTSTSPPVLPTAPTPSTSASTPTPAPAVREKPAKPAAAAPVKRGAPAKGWFVQAGTFSNPDNARQLVERLKKKGFKASSESVRIERNTVVRVHVGPFPKEAQAKEAQASLQRATDIKGLVRQY